MLRDLEGHLGQHLLIPCFLSPAENLASEGGRLLLLILIIIMEYKQRQGYTTKSTQTENNTQ